MLVGSSKKIMKVFLIRDLQSIKLYSVTSRTISGTFFLFKLCYFELDISQTNLTNLQVPTPQQDRKQMTTSTLSAAATETVGNEIFDAECLKLINEYFYGVR